MLVVLTALVPVLRDPKNRAAEPWSNDSPFNGGATAVKDLAEKSANDPDSIDVDNCTGPPFQRRAAQGTLPATVIAPDARPRHSPRFGVDHRPIRRNHAWSHV